ncbi:helix-turn-helix domain-containing protein [Glutamicibacter halophytocola]|uniref:Helix-turn-helix domain-containing protein n=1 Tax=Glutamicibacter halophytocola TaxID=1933880 RepID=A0ABX5YAF7_9MICC|nr:helix-turn-helix domain-containing protein [Glutamicibacter halophytocola]QDY66659.1 helix-turn-helix domain-containing protein [Glutamicibacter halophytocola]
MSRNHVIVHQIRDAGMSVTDASRHYKISRQRIYQLLHAYDDGGDSALEQLLELITLVKAVSAIYSRRCWRRRPAWPN